MKKSYVRILALFTLLFVIFGTLSVLAVLNNEEEGMRFDGLDEYKTASVEMTLPTTLEATVRFDKNATGGGVIFGNYADDATAGFNFGVSEGGATDGEALGHQWIEATVAAPQTCIRCGLTVGEKLPDESETLPDDGIEDGDGDADDGRDEVPTRPGSDHKDCKADFWTTFINAIVNFFRSLFGQPRICVCGKEI